jgi:AcrR family transcriptional regulator
MVPSRQERKEKIAGMRRQQILEAAMEVFATRGFATATTAEIARAAGVAEGTIYNYFPSKRALLITVIQNFIITTPLLELIEKLPEGDIAGTFSNILRNRLKLIDSSLVSRIPTLMAEIQRDPELKAMWAKQFLQPLLSRMEDIYRYFQASGKYRRIEPAIAVRALGGIIFGFLMLKIMEGDTSPLEKLPQDEIVESLANFILHGLLDDGLKDTS